MHRPVLQLLRQLFFGAMDMELHSANFDPTSSKVRVSPPLLQRNESTLLASSHYSPLRLVLSCGRPRTTFNTSSRRNTRSSRRCPTTGSSTRECARLVLPVPSRPFPHPHRAFPFPPTPSLLHVKRSFGHIFAGTSTLHSPTVRNNPLFTSVCSQEGTRPGTTATSGRR